MIQKDQLDQLACPKCFGDLSSKSGLAYCEKCRQKYPSLNGIPFLMAEPDSALAEWRLRVQYQLDSLLRESNQIEQGLATSKSLASRRRLETLQKGLKHNHGVWQRLTRPLQFTKNLEADSARALKAELPLAQSLMGYEGNIYRDWAWGQKENGEALRLVLELLGQNKKTAKVLILGAGAGRLAADLSRESRVESVTALDIHPFLLLFGHAMTTGESIDIFEFPVAPLGADDVAAMTKCRDEKGAADKVHWIAGDGLNPPFKGGSFDLILTPWFIDVVPMGIDHQAANINNLLREDGSWINFGPYGFLNNHSTDRWSQEEICEIVNLRGFKVSEPINRWMDYQQSPHSAQKRSENVYGFRADKVTSQPRPARFTHLPIWVNDWSRPVPAVEKIVRYRAANEMQLSILRLIDGHKSINDLARPLAEVSNLELLDASAAVATLLRQVFLG